MTDGKFTRHRVDPGDRLSGDEIPRWGCRHIHTGTSRMLNHVFAPRNRLKEGKERRIKPLERWSHHFPLTIPIPVASLEDHWTISLSGIAYQLISHIISPALPGCRSCLPFIVRLGTLYTPLFFLTYIFFICSNASILHLNALDSPVIS
ncbi:hypothetical protein PCH_Pc16g10880 [Penicillium rubens Wisconsin 54-1255]|jgi:hypothetical protein|uniref:Uncharacterized protein n=1 Tax=Penicillium rubens (strain ATCC 28089 / DSM 1075 / NRRL 1951 / Wisconsin 54-1255) TaxID=500485 RepID=B6H9G2_PENRW|nr:hypothetical protein PCH_Pc16g10880 [Penicillium rubens Wisconsin 54-1255]